MDGCPCMMEAAELPMHQRECGHNLVQCSFQGCREQCKAKDLSAHQRSCEHQPVMCPHVGCGLQCRAINIESHQRECIYRIMTCPRCSQSLMAKDLREHERNCAPLEVQVPRTRVEMGQMPTTIDDEQRLVLCPHEGCGMQLRAK